MASTVPVARVSAQRLTGTVSGAMEIASLQPLVKGEGYFVPLSHPCFLMTAATLVCISGCNSPIQAVMP